MVPFHLLYSNLSIISNIKITLPRFSLKILHQKSYSNFCSTFDLQFLQIKVSKTISLYTTSDATYLDLQWQNVIWGGLQWQKVGVCFILVPVAKERTDRPVFYFSFFFQCVCLMIINRIYCNRCRNSLLTLYMHFLRNIYWLQSCVTIFLLHIHI